ncbi:hypothetical protein DFH11DRAFT_1731116 [Phellopilus nigrolimitatus]|nr:hypothetical protein DFH11DRAFT_1731116 [Phellopilus nigrolimitatus]
MFRSDDGASSPSARSALDGENHPEPISAWPRRESSSARGFPEPDGKILINAIGISNFTNVASTFNRIIRALKEYEAGHIAVHSSAVRTTRKSGHSDHQDRPLSVKPACKSAVSSAHSIPPSAPDSFPPSKVIGAAPPSEASVGAISMSGGRTQLKDAHSCVWPPAPCDSGHARLRLLVRSDDGSRAQNLRVLFAVDAVPL